MKVSCILRGGLCNCLFTAAATISYSLKHNIDYCLPSEVQNPHSDNQKVFYSPHLKYCKEEHIGIRCFYNEKSFEYNEIPKQTCGFYILNGYFQSFRYIEPYREEIIKLFDIPYEFKKGYVAIHWRLSDYRVLKDFHPPVTLDYIHAGIKYFTDKGYKKFIVFSDEIDYCYDNIKVEGCNIGFSQGRTEVEDLSLASSCEHSIGSNSSYSWWIYWLNRKENKIGIFPKTWFGESMQHNTKDLYIPGSIII